MAKLRQEAKGRSEEREQARLIRWSHRITVRAVMPDLAWLHHSPNGGKRDAFTGAQMTALGVKSGFPDLILPVKRTVEGHVFSGLAIEMKSEGGRVMVAQAAWIDHLTANGWFCCVCRSAELARDLICTYLGTDPDKIEPLAPPA